jgi:hypothetical protein
MVIDQMKKLSVLARLYQSWMSGIFNNIERFSEIQQHFEGKPVLERSAFQWNQMFKFLSKFFTPPCLNKNSKVMNLLGNKAFLYMNTIVWHKSECMMMV